MKTRHTARTSLPAKGLVAFARAAAMQPMGMNHVAAYPSVAASLRAFGGQEDPLQPGGAGA